MHKVSPLVSMWLVANLMDGMGKTPLPINKSRKQTSTTGLHFTSTHFYILAHSPESFEFALFFWDQK